MLVHARPWRAGPGSLVPAPAGRSSNFSARPGWQTGGTSSVICRLAVIRRQAGPGNGPGMPSAGLWRIGGKCRLGRPAARPRFEPRPGRHDPATSRSLGGSPVARRPPSARQARRPPQQRNRHQPLGAGGPELLGSVTGASICRRPEQGDHPANHLRPKAARRTRRLGERRSPTRADEGRMRDKWKLVKHGEQLQFQR